MKLIFGMQPYLTKLDEIGRKKIRSGMMQFQPQKLLRMLHAIWDADFWYATSI
jgi:hypothetical protein